MRANIKRLASLLFLIAASTQFGFSNAYAQSVVVSNASQLHSAINTANSSGGNTTILLTDGQYTLNDTLYINASDITIAGQSGNRESVVIQGDAMSASASIGNLIRVAGSNFKLHDVTLQKSGWHLIQVVGESNADAPEIRDCILRDAYEQIIKVSVDANNLGTSSDNGIVENCLFEYTAGTGPQWYIGGIDAHAAKNWVIRNNVFRNIISPSSSVAEYAVHFWNTSANNIVEKNLIIDCDRGIGFGLDDRGNNAGIIRNNMIFHAANRGQFADVGIAVQNSPNTSIYNNTIYMQHGYPAAIEYRFSGTSNISIVNNLTNKSISRLDGANGTVASNETSAQSGWFVDTASGDLHLDRQIAEVVDRGQAVDQLQDDFDGDARPNGTAIDIGADELVAGTRPRAPSDLQVN